MRGGDEDAAPDIDAVESYAERPSDEVADAGGELATWAQDPDRDADVLGDIADGLRGAESDDGDLPSTGELAGTTFDIEGGTTSSSSNHVGLHREAAAAIAEVDGAEAALAVVEDLVERRPDSEAARVLRDEVAATTAG